MVTIVAMLKDAAREMTFDLSDRAEYLDPERLERTVYISPLAANVTPEMIKVHYGGNYIINIVVISNLFSVY